MFPRGKKRSRESAKDRSLSNRNDGKKRRVVADEEESRLERLIFGDTSNIRAGLNTDEALDVDIDEPVSSSAQLPQPSKNEDSGVDEGGISPSSADDCVGSHGEPAWMDEDDDGIAMEEAFSIQGRTVRRGGEAEYSSILKKKYEAIVGKPRWAELGTSSHSHEAQSDDDSDAEEMLQHCGGYLSRRGTRSLPKTTLEYKSLKHLNMDTRAEGPFIKAVEFHPTSTVALVAGLNGTASIVQVDGKVNTKLQSTVFERFPIHCAHFSQGGNQFYIGSAEHGYYYVYDMMAGRSLRVPINHHSEITQMKKFVMSPDGRIIAVQGKFGNIHLVSSHTNEWIGSLKMNGQARSFVFNNSGSRLYSHGDNSEVYIWDVKARSCVHRFTDDGCLRGTSLALSPNERYLACGSSSGVVNLYDASKLSHSVTPTPLKTVLNLVTPINSLEFNASSEILAMASRKKDNALKMLHLPSMTVFSNFPPRNENLNRIDTLDFSPHSGYFAVGNNRGSALLFRLKHFGNY